jgi:hypothetical protein
MCADWRVAKARPEAREDCEAKRGARPRNQHFKILPLYNKHNELEKTYYYSLQKNLILNKAGASLFGFECAMAGLVIFHIASLAKT